MKCCFSESAILLFFVTHPANVCVLQVRAIYIHTEMFSIENGLLTPTMKAKRNEMRQHFRPQIEELYAGIKM